MVAATMRMLQGDCTIRSTRLNASPASSSSNVPRESNDMKVPKATRAADNQEKTKGDGENWVSSCSVSSTCSHCSSDNDKDGQSASLDDNHDNDYNNVIAVGYSYTYYPPSYPSYRACQCPDDNLVPFAVPENNTSLDASVQNLPPQDGQTLQTLQISQNRPTLQTSQNEHKEDTSPPQVLRRLSLDNATAFSTSTVVESDNRPLSGERNKEPKASCGYPFTSSVGAPTGKESTELSRITVNTHTSILNFAEEDDDEDDEDDEVLAHYHRAFGMCGNSNARTTSLLSKTVLHSTPIQTNVIPPPERDLSCARRPLHDHHTHSQQQKSLGVGRIHNTASLSQRQVKSKSTRSMSFPSRTFRDNFQTGATSEAGQASSASPGTSSLPHRYMQGMPRIQDSSTKTPSSTAAQRILPSLTKPPTLGSLPLSAQSDQAQRKCQLGLHRLTESTHKEPMSGNQQSPAVDGAKCLDIPTSDITNHTFYSGSTTATSLTSSSEGQMSLQGQVSNPKLSNTVTISTKTKTKARPDAALYSEHNTQCSSPVSKKSTFSKDNSFVDQVMDQFVEGFLCRVEVTPNTTNSTATATTVTTSNKTKSSASPTTTAATTNTSDLWEGYRRLIEYDILIVLGCIDPPEQDEIENLWSWPKMSKAGAPFPCPYPRSASFTDTASGTSPQSSSSLFYCLGSNTTAQSPFCTSLVATDLMTLVRRHHLRQQAEPKQNGDEQQHKTPHDKRHLPHRLTLKQRCTKIHRIRQEMNMPAIETGLVLLSPLKAASRPSLSYPKSLYLKNSPLAPFKSPIRLLPRSCRSFEESQSSLLDNQALEAQSAKSKTYHPFFPSFYSSLSTESNSKPSATDDDDLRGYDTDPELQCQRRPKESDSQLSSKLTHDDNSHFHFCKKTFISPADMLPRSIDPTSIGTSQLGILSFSSDYSTNGTNTVNKSVLRNHRREWQRQQQQESILRDNILCNELISQQVLETFNVTWTLKWHNCSTVTPTTSSSLCETVRGKATVCKVWIERGALVRSNSIMIEPALKWFPVQFHTQPFRLAAPSASKGDIGGNGTEPHNLQESANRPYSLPLLKICRILPAEECHLSSWEKYAASVNCGLMLKNHCIVIRCSRDTKRSTMAGCSGGSTRLGTGAVTSMSDGVGEKEGHVDDNLFIFEAPSMEIRNDTIQRWKVIIARFAALAVLEDADAILAEYFMTSTSNAMPPGPPPPLGANFPIQSGGRRNVTKNNSNL